MMGLRWGVPRASSAELGAQRPHRTLVSSPSSPAASPAPAAPCPPTAMRAWEDSAVTFARGAGPTTCVGRAFLLCGCCTGDARLLPRGSTFQRNRLSPGAPAWTARRTFTAGLDDTHGLDLPVSAPDFARRGFQTPDPGCGTGTLPAFAACGECASLLSKWLGCPPTVSCPLSSHRLCPAAPFHPATH